MAIAGFSVKTGAKGTATAHAAYVARTGAYERYTERGEVLEAREHGNMPSWAAHDPSRFWQAADAHERANGSSYREFLISLPRELSPDERRALVKDFVAQELGETHAYQYAIHVPKASDGLDNPHVHLMFSERRRDGIDRDPAQYFRRFNARHPERGGCQKGFGEQPGVKLTATERKAELKVLRERWGVCVNAALERAGHSARVNMKSYADRGLEIVPEPKQLPSAWRGEGREAVLAFRAARAAELEVQRDPGVIIERVSAMKALFTRQDLYRSLNAVTDDVDVFNAVKAQLDAHPLLVPLETGQVPGSSRELLTTREVLETEASITALGQVLSKHGAFGLSGPALERALMSAPQLSDEQRAAVEHVTGDQQLAIVAGVAGSGKSTLLSVVREGYETAGYRVSGVALAGKAADELRRSSGIASRTLASWLYRLDQGMLSIDSTDVIVLDEAGMVHNGTMNRVLDAANRVGAKVILVGDAEQLQPIQAGCPFRSLSDAHGVARIDTVRRQSQGWQREATQALSRGEGWAALSAYDSRGHTHLGAEASLVPALVSNYLSGELASSMILAHRKKDVAMLNRAVRSERIARGELDLSRSGKIGEMAIAPGDRVVFAKNDSGLGVLNGQFGEVVDVKEQGLRVDVQVDAGSLVSISTDTYTALQHGYASTIHKSQGMTVDRAMLWGSASLDRHLGYVGMSRHREQLDIYQPTEANEVRPLERCLARTTRATTVEAAMVEHGLEVRVEKDGRTRLARTYPSAVEVDASSDLLTRVRLQVGTRLTEEQAAREQAVSASESAYGAHEQAEPERRGLLSTRAAQQARAAWERDEVTLREAVLSARTSLSQWEKTKSARHFRHQLISEGVRRQSVDPLSPAGGVECDTEGRVRITERYPIAAREDAVYAADVSERSTQGYFEEQERRLIGAVNVQGSRLADHRRSEPATSAFDVVLNQTRAQARKAWDEQLPILEASAQEAEEKLAVWRDALAESDVVKEMRWSRFVDRAPDALTIHHKTLEAEKTRAKRFDGLREYHFVEKVLESKFGQSLKEAYVKTRAQLVERFSHDRQQARLPEGLQQRVVMHREVKAQERALSRGRGMER